MDRREWMKVVLLGGKKEREKRAGKKSGKIVREKRAGKKSVKKEREKSCGIKQWE
jgi:hypothetical protein